MAEQDQASVSWRWSYSGAGCEATGLFTTSGPPNAEGFFQIAAIEGQANGVVISSLVPTGTSVPGNEPFTVDNLVRLPTAEPLAQLTEDGVGFSLADGTYANPFYKTDGSPPEYRNFTSDPATKQTNEIPIHFTAVTAA